ncbi:gibberellin 3-beta-dioxygenase 1-like [Argentina anserina]|uniref:gibberellin 3-beta-dioxygenase 1-like n=1 Tax=Argentina anserina TaxID=57926 RepID=UPI00217687B6|nr:gibberellin 3-beta-dioxygenase 1-like [Potentilla anserina]
MSSTNLSHIVPLDFNSVHTLPDSHSWDSSPDHHSFTEFIPVIDLHDPNAATLIRLASEQWGVFQVTNHGIPMNIVQEAELQARGLFELPRDQKLRALRSPESFSGYGRAPISANFTKLMWSEGFTMMGSPFEHAAQLWPDDYSVQTHFCNVMEDYQKKMKGFCGKLLQLMLGSLGLDHEDVKWLKRPKKSSRSNPQVLQLNSYPVCPDPTRAIGLAPHTDSSIFTVLNQCSISGLQVLEEGIGWVLVHPIPGALVVNVGDLMHILSNGRFKTTMHRAVVNEEHHRISIAYFYGPPYDVKISPPMKLIDQDHPLLYRPVTWKEYLGIKGTHFNWALEKIRNDLNQAPCIYD